MGGWAWDDDPPTPESLRLIENARRLYDRIAEIVAGPPDSFEVTSELILEFHRIATAGEPDPEKPPGIYRVRDNVIASRGGVALHQPPPTAQVLSLINEMCDAIRDRWHAGTTFHVAAYALWRLNWIHPFPDGNGKTSRALMYTILCVGHGRMLPGETALPDLISRSPRRYWSALESADRAWAWRRLGRGEHDLRPRRTSPVPRR